MKVKDYPEYGTIYEIGNAKIIALDREDKMLNICCPTLVQGCKMRSILCMRIIRKRCPII